MKISTRGRYALKMMIEFAMSPDKATKINQVAKSQEISEKYLEQIVSLLSKAGYVKSIRGSHGGYVLTKPANEYSVGDILRVTEGSLAPVFCLEDDAEPCYKDKICATKRVFKQIEDAINNVVDNITLEDLLKDTLAMAELEK